MIDLIPAKARFVSYLDMLGFSGLLTCNLNRAWALLCDFERLKSGPENLRFGFDRKLIEVETVFSDSIVIISRDDSDESMRAIVRRTLEVFSAAFQSSIPLRGAIAHGEMIVSHEPLLFTGPAFVEAHRLGESQQFLGVSLDYTTEQRLTHSIPLTTDAELLFEWNVPVKQRCESQPPFESRSVLNWPMACDPSLRPPSNVTPRDFQARFTEFGSFGELPPAALTKYTNTTEFLKVAESYNLVTPWI